MDFIVQNPNFDSMSLEIQHPASVRAELEQDNSFSLGFKELLFLATILFIGFCGFTVCVEKIYGSPDYNEINSITVYDKDISFSERQIPTYDQGYSVE